MAFVERQASSPKPQNGRRNGQKGGRGGKGGKGGGDSRDKVKSNIMKRERLNDELRELQARVGNYTPPAEITTFSQLPLSSRTLKGLKSSHFLNPTPIQSLSIPPSLRGRDVLGSARTGSGKTLAFLIPLLERLYLLKWGPMDGLGAVVISPTRELAVQTFTQLRDIGKYHNFSAGLVIGGKPLKEERDRLSRMNILIATPGRLLQHLDSTVGFESSGVKVLVLDEADRLLDLGFLPALRAIVGHFSPSTLPDGRPDRQTLLFSATQSKDLASLAKLSLHDPLYINCNKPGEEGVVPTNLEQFYSVVGLERKLDALWGFVKSHLKMKGVVFVTSGKQVRFIFETFRRLHPGLPLMHLHGKQKQPTRLTIFQRFSSSKTALLICTDVAARGLDFPAVDWVVQLDCPEDVDTYIHRVGRTARYESEGKALLFLCPSEEEGMLARWKEKAIEVKKIKIKESKMGNLRQQMQNFAFKEPEIKYLGQRAFISYMRAVHIQKDKTIFDVAALPAEEYAASMGLPGAPQIKLSEPKTGKARVRAGQKKEEPIEQHEDEVAVVASSDESGDEDEDDVDTEAEAETGGAASVNEQDSEGESDEESGGESGGESDEESDDDDQDEEESESDISEEERPIKAPEVRTKYDRMFERKNQSILTPHYTSLIAHNDGDEEGEEDDVFTLARRDHALSGDEDENAAEKGGVNATANSKSDSKSVAAAKPLVSSEDLSKRKLKAGTSKKARVKTGPAPEKLVFDEQGNPTNFYEEGTAAESGAAGQRAEYVEMERERMRAADKVDREVAREKKREKKRKRKERERELMQDSDEEEEGPVAMLGGGDYDDDEEYGSPSEEDEPPVVYKSDRSERGHKRARHEADLEDEEALALRLLQGA